MLCEALLGARTGRRRTAAQSDDQPTDQPAGLELICAAHRLRRLAGRNHRTAPTGRSKADPACCGLRRLSIAEEHLGLFKADWIREPEQLKTLTHQSKYNDLFTAEIAARRAEVHAHLSDLELDVGSS